MYIPWFPCIECAKAIIQCGISRIVAYQPDLEDAKWGAEFLLVQEMLKEARISIKYIERLEDLPTG